jgi:Cu/Ag efflux protein CusF
MKKLRPAVFALMLGIALPTALYAQESMKGEITKLDEASGTVTIKQSPSGTVGSASETAAARDYKVKDGLVFNALKPGDQVTFTTETSGGNAMITKIEQVK